MQNLLRGLASRRDAAWADQTRVEAAAPRPSLWRRYSWVLLVGVVLVGASVALGNAASTVGPRAETAPTPTAEAAPDLTATADAAPVAAYTDPLVLQNDTPWGDLALDMGLKLAIVLALLLGTLWLIRYVRARRGPAAGSPTGVGFAEILDATELSTGQHVYILDLGDRVLVLGSTAQQVSSLSEITDDDEIEALRRRTGVRRQRSFAGVLSGALERALPERRPRRTATGDTSIASADGRRRELRQSAARLRRLTESYRERKHARA